MEQAFSFNIENKNALGIIHHSEMQNDVGVLIVVGGPQYRIGSHRQFVQLSRELASHQFATMRFDYRGMGDSSGEKQAFHDIDTDIRTAIDNFFTQAPYIKKVVLWGLCDAASAAMIYAHQDARVKGLVLLNPWLESEQAKAKTMLKFYYLKRLTSKAFWKKLLGGNVNVSQSLGEAKGFIGDSVKTDKQTNASYQHRMAHGFNKYTEKMCFLLSGNDLTSQEFQQQTTNSNQWQKLHDDSVTTHHLPEADHTFSSAEYKKQVADLTAQFIKTIS